MTDTIVEHLTGSILVRLPNGTEIACRPLLLGGAMPLMKLYRIGYNPDKTPFERAEARLQLIEEFTKLYPELVAHIGALDVEYLVPDFFWSAAGAQVIRPTPETPSNGTTSGAATLPVGASSPT